MVTLLMNLAETGDESIRGIIDPRGLQVFSVYDFMTKACGYRDNGDTARSAFRRMTNEGMDTRDELLTAINYVKFPGQRGPDTPCMTIRGLQRLLMILGGKVATEFRMIAEGVFTRVMAGDQSMIAVIHANAASKAPVQQALRAALAQEPVVPAVDKLFLTKKREREEAHLDLDLEERKLELEERKLVLQERKRALKHAAFEDVAEGVKLVSSINLDGVADPEFKQRVQGYITDVMLTSSDSFRVPVITAPPVAPVARVGGAASK